MKIKGSERVDLDSGSAYVQGICRARYVIQFEILNMCTVYILIDRHGS